MQFITIPDADHPLVGIWGVEGLTQTYQGTLYENKGKFFLQITIGADEFDLADHPIKDPVHKIFKAGLHIHVFGQTTKYSCVSLFDCLYLSCNELSRRDAPVRSFALTLFPSQVWAGTAFVNPQLHCEEVSLRITGLHQLLSTVNVSIERLIKDDAETEADPRDQKITIRHGRGPRSKISKNDREFEISFSEFFSYSTSATNGKKFQTNDAIYISSDSAALSEFLDVAYEVEKFLSILGIGVVRSQETDVRTEQIGSATRLWDLRDPQENTLNRMAHEMVADISKCPDLIENALVKWFEADEERGLARWLVLDTLSEENTSTSSFLAVAQAWEIIGRQTVSGTVHAPATLRKACKAARAELRRFLEAEAADRMIGLLLSSNQVSFAKMLETVLHRLPDLAVNLICPDLRKFSSTVARVRNTLTHMSGKKEMSIQKASRIGMHLTYKLAVLFCIAECQTLGMPMTNLRLMLGNNEYGRTAIRPLPED